MSPRQDQIPYIRDSLHHSELLTRQFKERFEEENMHHPEEHLNPHLKPHSHEKMCLYPDSDTQLNIPHDELLLHLNTPSPIKAKKNSTQLGGEISKTLNFVRFY